MAVAYLLIVKEIQLNVTKSSPMGRVHWAAIISKIIFPKRISR